MAQITNLTIAIGSIESRSLGSSTPFSPPPIPHDYRRITLNFLMTFSPQEIGLTYRLTALLFANDNLVDDASDGKLFVGEDAGLTKISQFQSPNDRWNLFPKSYKDILVTNVSMPYTISEFVLEGALNEDPDMTILGMPTRTIPSKDELLARVVLSQVAEVKSVSAAL